MAMPEMTESEVVEKSDDAAEPNAVRKLRAVAGMRSITEEARSSLGELASALEGGGADLDSWAAVDLRTAFAPDTALKPPTATLWFGRLLDVCVFAPIASTWFGLMVATEAYNSTLGDPKLAGQNFLQRWQDGFDGHVLWGLSFGVTAMITFGLVAGVLGLALVHLLLRTRADQGSQARAYRLLSEALTAAERELAPVRLGAVGRVAAELGRVSVEVAATADEVRKVGEVAGRAQEEAAAGLVTMGETIEKITAAIVAVQVAAGEVARAVMDMGGQLAEAAAATSAVADTEAEFGEKLLDATGKLDATVDGLADRLTTAVASGQTQLSRAVADSSERVADSLRDSADQVRRAVGELEATAAGNTAHVRAAAGSLAAVRDATVRLPDALTRIDREVTDLNAAIVNLTRAVDAMKIPAVRPLVPSGPSGWSAKPAGRMPGSAAAGFAPAGAGSPESGDGNGLWTRLVRLLGRR